MKKKWRDEYSQDSITVWLVCVLLSCIIWYTRRGNNFIRTGDLITAQFHYSQIYSMHSKWIKGLTRWQQVRVQPQLGHDLIKDYSVLCLDHQPVTNSHADWHQNLFQVDRDQSVTQSVHNAVVIRRSKVVRKNNFRRDEVSILGIY